MQYVSTILNQMIVMAIYMVIGYALSAAKIITSDGSKGLSNFLLYVILPCVVINSFLREYTPETTRALLIAFGLGTGLLLLAMLVSAIIFKKNPVDNFSASFSNAGFMGIPLITAVLGSEYVIYAAGMVAMLNILQWTYGQYIMDTQHKTKGGLKGLMLNPIIVSLVIGLLLYFLRITLPGQLKSCVTTIAGCNAPLAMCIIGVFLRGLPLKKIFTDSSAYMVTLVRLIVIPILSILAICWMPWISVEIKTALVILACAPVGSNVAIYAQKLGQDHNRAVTEVCLSTIFALGTMPLMLLILSLLAK